MDGPNTDWAFYQAVSDLRKSENLCAPDLLEIGSCGLHVVHSAFGTGVGKLIRRWERSSILHRPFSRSLLPEDQIVCLRIILSAEMITTVCRDSFR